jgi:hypothetical protein
MNQQVVTHFHRDDQEDEVIYTFRDRFGRLLEFVDSAHFGMSIHSSFRKPYEVEISDVVVNEACFDMLLRGECPFVFDDEAERNMELRYWDDKDA